MAQIGRLKLRGGDWRRGQENYENEPSGPARFFARDNPVQMYAPLRRALDDPNNTRPTRPGRPGDQQPWPADPQRPPEIPRPGPPRPGPPPQAPPAPPAPAPSAPPPSPQGPTPVPASTANRPTPAPAAPNPSDGGAKQSGGDGTANPTTTREGSEQQTPSLADAHDKDKNDDENDNDNDNSTGALTTVLSTMTGADGSVTVQTSVISQNPTGDSAPTDEQGSTSGGSGLSQGQIAGIVVGIVGE
jgi:hypothetical protein